MGINFWDPNNQNQDQGQGQGEGQGQLSLQGQGQAQAQIAADLNGNLNGNGNGNLNGNGNFNADGNLNGNLNDNVNHNTDTVCVDVSVDASVTPLIGDLSDATALYMPQDISQSFTAGGTDTAIALDQINSLVANNSAATICEFGWFGMSATAARRKPAASRRRHQPGRLGHWPTAGCDFGGRDGRRVHPEHRSRSQHPEQLVHPRHHGP